MFVPKKQIGVCTDFKRIKLKFDSSKMFTVICSLIVGRLGDGLYIVSYTDLATYCLSQLLVFTLYSVHRPYFFRINYRNLKVFKVLTSG